MTRRILVVDDEPDLEALIQQKFRRQIRNGTVSFLFAHDGVEALNPDVDLVVTDIDRRFRAASKGACLRSPVGHET